MNGVSKMAGKVNLELQSWLFLLLFPTASMGQELSNLAYEKRDQVN